MFIQQTLKPISAPIIPTNLPWVQKQQPLKSRPQSIDQLSYQQDIVNALQSSLHTQNLPHLLFYGPPGTGKTSAILALAKSMFGLDQYRSRVLELNASDDRGIQVVRQKVKKFAQIAVLKSSLNPLPSFKIIILDQADSLTPDAQAALRRIIQKYTKVTRFCLVCNYISKIIDPLASRCVKFRFKPISVQAQLQRLKIICEAQGISCTDQAYNNLISLSEGDLRRSITTLQSTFRVFGSFINGEMVITVAAVTPRQVVDQTFNAITSSFIEVKSIADSIQLNGFQPDNLMFLLAEVIWSRPDISDLKKAKTSQIFAQNDYCLTAGANQTLVVLKVLTQLRQVLIN